MNKTPKLSVIIPVYNVEPYLYQCLESVARQTLKEIEIIVVNDASRDNSQQIIDDYVRRDSRVISVIHEHNCGLGAARNTGIKYAKANIVGFIDSDDYIEPTMYADMYEMLVANELEMVQCSMERVFIDKMGKENFYAYFEVNAGRL